MECIFYCLLPFESLVKCKMYPESTAAPTNLGPPVERLVPFFSVVYFSRGNHATTPAKKSTPANTPAEVQGVLVQQVPKGGEGEPQLGEVVELPPAASKCSGAALGPLEGPCQVGGGGVGENLSSVIYIYIYILCISLSGLWEKIRDINLSASVCVKTPGCFRKLSTFHAFIWYLQHPSEHGRALPFV